MTIRRHRSPLADFLHRLVAGSSAALTLLLAVLVASPQLHQHVHGEDAGAHDDCAVVLFGAGVTPAIDFASVQAPAIAWREQASAPIVEVFVVAPRYLRQPERGPPLS